MYLDLYTYALRCPWHCVQVLRQLVRRRISLIYLPFRDTKKIYRVDQLSPPISSYISLKPYSTPCISEVPASYSYRRHTEFARGLVIEARPTSPHLLKYKAKPNFPLPSRCSILCVEYNFTTTYPSC
jgi:hypothetical protein